MGSCCFLSILKKKIWPWYCKFPLTFCHFQGNSIAKISGSFCICHSTWDGALPGKELCGPFTGIYTKGLYFSPCILQCYQLVRIQTLWWTMDDFLLKNTSHGTSDIIFSGGCRQGIHAVERMRWQQGKYSVARPWRKKNSTLSGLLPVRKVLNRSTLHGDCIWIKAVRICHAGPYCHYHIAPRCRSPSRFPGWTLSWNRLAHPA